MQEVANKGWKVKVNKTDEGELAEDSNNDEKQITPGELLEFLAGKNIKISRKDGQIILSTKEDVTFSTVQTPTLSVTDTFRSTGDNFFGGQGKTFSLAAGTKTDFGGNVLSNIGKGVKDTDAANMANLKEKIDTLEKLLTDRGLNIQGNVGTDSGENKFLSPLGSTVEIVGGAADNTQETFSGKNLRTRIVSENNQNKVLIELSNTPTLDSVQAGTVNSTTVNVAEGGTFNAANATTNLGNTNIGGKNADGTNKAFNVLPNTETNFGGNVLDNVGDAKVEEGSKKAINGGVLYTALDNLNDTLTNKGLNFAANSKGETDQSSIARKLGETLNIVGGGTLADDKYSAENVKTVAREDGIEIRILKNPTFENLAVKENLEAKNLTATGNTTLGGEGSTFKVEKGTQVDMGGNKISNVGSGNIAKGSSDAVNGGDVHAKLEELRTDLTNNALTFAGNAPADATATENVYKQNLHAGPMHIVGGGTLDDDQYSAENVKTFTTDKGIEIRIAKNPSFEHLKADNLTVGGEGKNFNVAEGTKVNFGGNVISGVKAGDVSSQSTDAVNGAQLYALQESPLTFIGNDGNTARKLNQTLEISGAGTTKGDYSSVNVKTNVTDGKVEILLADRPTFAGGLDAGGKTIDNVADGQISPTSTQAVNGRQIFALVGSQPAPEVKNSYTSTITHPDGTIEEVTVDNVVVDKDGNALLKTYNVQDQKEYVTNSVITAINNMNTQGIKFFHTNDGTEKKDRPKDQAENSQDSSASGKYATAVGFSAKAAGENSVAFGHGAIAGKRELKEVVRGNGETLTLTVYKEAKNAIAIGNGAVAANKNTIAIGTGNQVTGENSGAIGDPSIIDGDNSYSVGNNNQVAKGKHDVFVLGNNVTVVESRSVFLGDKSGYVQQGATTQGNAVYDKIIVNGREYHFAGGKADQVVGVLSVGHVDTETGSMETRRIQNVAPGLLSAESTDAINGSQLYAVVEQGWSLETGTVEGSVNSKSTHTSSPKSTVSLGSLVTINAGNNVEIEHNSETRTINIATSMNPNLEGIKIISPNAVVDMGGNRIQNVGKAVAPTDAVNYGQFRAELGKVDRDLRAGIAAATAISFLQRAHQPGESLVSVAVGGYANENAIAVGYAKNSDNNRVSIKLGVGLDSRHKLNYGGSVGYRF